MNLLHTPLEVQQGWKNELKEKRSEALLINQKRDLKEREVKLILSEIENAIIYNSTSCVMNGDGYCAICDITYE